MPTYDYKCNSCNHQFEVFQSMKDDLLTCCPECEEAALQRLIGSGAGIIFKGSGFYETDYKKAAADNSQNVQTEKKQSEEKKDSTSGEKSSKTEPSSNKSGGSEKVGSATASS